MSDFPTYESHDKASCFNCGGDLIGEWWSRSGYAPGRGYFKCDCSKCGVTTWYDLKDETPR